MKQKILPILAGVLALAGCAPLDIYYKPGASVARLNRQTLSCETQALREVPPSVQVRRGPPRYVPARRHCRKGRHCHSRGGFFVPGDLITYDPNDGLRKRVELQCMADQGFVPVSIPRCPDRVARAVPAQATFTLPVLTENACVIHNGDGSFQIVIRG